MKLIYKDPKDVSQKKKVVDVYKKAKAHKWYLVISLLCNVAFLGAIAALLHK